MTNKVALIVAVVLGVFSILLVKRYIDQMQQKVMGDLQPVTLLVARQDIKAGEELSDSMVEKTQFPIRFSQSVKQAIPDSDLKGYLGSELIADVDQGQVLQSTHFKRMSGKDPFEPVKVEAGWRAVSIPVDKIGGLSAMLRPGDYVDVYVYLDVQVENRQQPVQATALLLHKVLVYAVDNLTYAEEGRYIRGYSTVTVRVKPDEQAEVIHIAQRGRFQLAKMSNEESATQHADVAPVTTDTVYEKLKKILEKKPGGRG